MTDTDCANDNLTYREVMEIIDEEAELIKSIWYCDDSLRRAQYCIEFGDINMACYWLHVAELNVTARKLYLLYGE